MSKAICSAYLSMVAIAVMVNAPPTCLTSIKESFSLSETEGGFLLSSLFWGFALTIMITGPLADRFGMKPFLVTSALLQIWGLITCALSPVFNVMVAGAFLMGMGSGMLEVLVSPLVCILRPDDKTKAMNFCHSFYSIGAVLTVVSASILLKVGLSWRYVYLLGSIPSLLFGLGYLTSSLPPLLRSDGKAISGFSLMRSPVFLLMLSAMLLGGGTELGSAQWIPAYLEEGIGLSRMGGAFGLVLFSAAMALGRMVMSRISGGRDPVSMLKLSSLFCAFLLFSSGLLRFKLPVMGIFFLLGFFVSIFWPTILACSSERFPEGGATMFSLLSAAGNGGGMLFPALVGFIADRSSLRVGIGSLALLPILLLIVLSAV